MKKRLLLLLLFVVTIMNSQVSNIANLTSGDLQAFYPIEEVDGSVFGYFTIYKLEKVSKTEERFEYVLLDKNLNKVSNGQFIEPKYKGYYTKFISPEKIGNSILITTKAYPVVQLENWTKFIFTSNKVLNLDTNKMSTSFYSQNGEIKEGNRAIKGIRGVVKKEDSYNYPLAFSDGFFMFQQVKAKSKKLKNVTSLQAYNTDKTLKWSYDYNIKKEELSYGFEVLDEDNILFQIYNKKTKTSTFSSLDPKTGKEIFKYEFYNKKSEFSHYYYSYGFKDRFVIVGKYSRNRGNGYNSDKSLGYFRIEIDKKGNEISKKYLKWEDLASVIKIKDNGKLEDDNYRLSSKQIFVFEDGSVAMVNEKRKENYNLIYGATNVKTTDFIVLNFDKDFNIKSSKTIEKQKSKWTYSDFLFSREVDKGNGGAFFYADYKKNKEGGKSKKNWALGIVTIKGGDVYDEQIPMSSKDHFLYPYVAKEGYILLREFNKDEDYDQIRLERLNY